MTIKIGRSGQLFNKDALNKVTFLKNEIVKITVIDGGVNNNNIKTIIDSGARMPYHAHQYIILTT